MAKQEPLSWTWNDAWVLMSLYIGGGKGVNLRALISTGDYINRSIFSYAEINEGMRKLIAIGLVKVADKKFSLTPKFTRLYNKLAKHPRGVLAAANQMEMWLKETAWKYKPLEEISGDVLSEELVRKAYEEYSDAMNKL